MTDPSDSSTRPSGQLPATAPGRPAATARRMPSDIRPSDTGPVHGRTARRGIRQRPGLPRAVVPARDRSAPETASESVPPTETAPVSEAVPAPGRGVTAAWWYTFCSMAFIALFMPLMILAIQRVSVQAFGGAPHALVVAVDVLLVVSVVTGVYGCTLLRAGLGGGRARLRDALLVLVPPAAIWVLTLWLPGAAATGAFPLWMAMNILLPLHGASGRRAGLVLGAALYTLHWWLGVQVTGQNDESPFLVSVLIFTALCPLMFLLSVWWWDVMVKLDVARRDSAQLAVARERLRFASDLHDIQGHHLQVIALKAELAERLLDRDPQAAREDIHEVRTLARTALEETRSLVRDLRAVSLEEELGNAKDVLEAAGATTTVRTTAVADPALRTLFGLAVREAATNILRHSVATTVTITLQHRAGEYLLRVENDGALIGDRDGDGNGEAGGDGPASGTGLAGLHRRFAAAGGSITGSTTGSVNGRHDVGRFVLQAWLPAAAGSTVQNRREGR